MEISFEKVQKHQVCEIEVSYKTNLKADERLKITSSQDSVNYLRHAYDINSIEHHESFYVLLLNRANKVLGHRKISQGGVNGTIADPKMIMQVALKANASSIILSHNHPSGHLRPSEADIELTKKIKQGGDLLDICVLDHIIISPEWKYYSFADEGKMR